MVNFIGIWLILIASGLVVYIAMVIFLKSEKMRDEKEMNKILKRNYGRKNRFK